MMALFVWWFALPAIARRLMGAVLVCGIIAAAVLVYGSHREATGYTKGWNHAVVLETRKQIVIVDSLERRADSAAAKAKQLSAIVRDSAQPILSAPRHTPRLEALTVPVVADTSLVGVFVQTTGEHFVLPRRAAMYWATSDSLVGVAQQLIKKYAAANAGWANAYTAEHEARVGADSLSALWRTRALANIPPAAGKSHRLVYVALGAVAGFIAAKRIH